MPVHNRKLPDDTKLARDVAAGMTAAQIAVRYKTTQDHLRRRLKAIGAVPAAGPTASFEPSDIPRIVIEKRVTAAEYGGTIVQRISLPRISMHVAAMGGRI